MIGGNLQLGLAAANGFSGAGNGFSLHTLYIYFNGCYGFGFKIVVYRKGVNRGTLAGLCAAPPAFLVKKQGDAVLGGGRVYAGYIFKLLGVLQQSLVGFKKRLGGANVAVTAVNIFSKLQNRVAVKGAKV